MHATQERTRSAACAFSWEWRVVERIRNYSAPAVLSAVLCLSACGGSDSSSAPPPIAVTFGTAPPTTLSADDTASISAMVGNDATNSGVKWSASCSSSQCGSFNPQSTASGTATTYTPPASVSASITVTLTVTSAADPTKSVSAGVTVTPVVKPVLSDGTYVYHFLGQDDSGPLSVAGAFAVHDGAITGGEQDVSDNTGSVTNTILASGSSLTVAGDNIQIVLNTGNADLGHRRDRNLRGASVSASRALISEFDAAATGTGSLDLQGGVSQPTGGYAFVTSGWHGASQLAIGGILDFNGTALSVADSVFDISNGPSRAQAQTFTSGTVTVPDSFGRISISLQPSAASLVPSLILTGYVIDSNRIELVEDQTDALNGALGGTALGQGSNTGTFTTASVLNDSYAYGLIGEDTNGPAAMAGGFIFNAGGTVSGRLVLSDMINNGGNQINAGTYTVDSDGRITLSGIVAQPLNATLGFQLYLDGHGNGLVMGMDALETTAGPAFLQTGNTAVLSGSYAISARGFTKLVGVPVLGRGR